MLLYKRLLLHKMKQVWQFQISFLIFKYLFPSTLQRKKKNLTKQHEQTQNYTLTLLLVITASCKINKIYKTSKYASKQTHTINQLPHIFFIMRDINQETKITVEGR